MQDDREQTSAALGASPAGSTGIGTAIRRRRTELGQSQRALARAADVSAAFISQIENDQRQPSLGVLERIAMALHVSSSLLLAAGQEQEEDAGLLGLVHPARSLDEIEALIHDEAESLRLVAAARELVAGPRATDLEAYVTVIVEYADLLEAFARHQYRAMTGPSIVVATSALSYVVDPDDAWPDAHPHGHLDDVGVLAFTHALVADELADFHAWRRSR